MKRPVAIGIAMLAAAFAVAQQPPSKPYLKEHMDSLRKMGWPKGDTAAPGQTTVPNAGIYGRPRNFMEINGKAVLLHATSRGKVYALPPDNMPVLAPDMTLTEKMPGSSRTYQPAPPSRMPNPLYPRKKRSS